MENKTKESRYQVKVASLLSLNLEITMEKAFDIVDNNSYIVYTGFVNGKSEYEVCNLLVKERELMTKIN